MDPFIIIRNYRQQRQSALEELTPTTAPPASRLFLKELDPNALVNRQVALKRSVNYCEEDKENYCSLLETDRREDLMKKLPTPNQFHLINYEEYDLN